MQSDNKKKKKIQLVKDDKKKNFVHIWHAHHLFRKNVKTSEKIRYCSKFAKYTKVPAMSNWNLKLKT